MCASFSVSFPFFSSIDLVVLAEKNGFTPFFQVTQTSSQSGL